MWDAHGYVLAQDIAADRDYPPFDRATRDGYAVTAAEANAGAALACVGEIKAGDAVADSVAENTCVQIMTGAPVPADADAVVMVEFTRSDGETVRFERDAAAGQNIVPRGSESRRGQKLLNAGTRLGFAELALAAQVGATQLRCAKKPRVAILSTGDELVAVDAEPEHVSDSKQQQRLAGGASGDGGWRASGAGQSWRFDGGVARRRFAED